jgi:hypothetical protein
MSKYQLAQLNVAVMKEPLESPGMADFVANQGPTPEAFTFRQAFLAPDARQPDAPFAFGDECPA